MGLLDSSADEGGLEGGGLLPSSWRSQCLNYSTMSDTLAAAARGQQAELPDAHPEANRRRPKATPPALLPALQGDERHRRFAELLVRELDAVYMFMSDERGESWRSR